jgi:hypothetical protein
LGSVQVKGRTRSFDLPDVDVPVGAIFGDAMELVGYALQSPDHELHPESDVAINLVWRAVAAVDADYTVTVQLLGPDGRVYGQRDAPPLGGEAPTSTWSQSEILGDPYLLTVAPDAPPGEYQLIVAMYLLETGERLPVEGGHDAVVLDRIEIVP